MIGAVNLLLVALAVCGVLFQQNTEKKTLNCLSFGDSALPAARGRRRNHGIGQRTRTDNTTESGLFRGG